MRDIVGQSLGVMSPGHRLNQNGIDHVSQGLSSPLHSEYLFFVFLNIYLFYTCLRLCALCLGKNKNGSTEYFCFFFGQIKNIFFFQNRFILNMFVET